MSVIREFVRNISQLFEEDDGKEKEVDQVILDLIWEEHPSPKESVTLNMLAFEGDWDDLTTEQIITDLKYCNDSVVLKTDLPVLEGQGYFRYTGDEWVVRSEHQEYRGDEAEELLDVLHGAETKDVLPVSVGSSPFE